jgi:hypothetical protein
VRGGLIAVNPAARLPRVSAWIVVALANVLALLVVTALTLMVVEPGLLRAIGGALFGQQQMAGPCVGGAPTPC